MSDRSTILLTGASGLLGRYLTPALGRLGRVVRLARRQPGPDGVALDLTDRAATEALLDSLRPSLIVHTAALTNVDACEKDPAEAWRQNVLANRHLAQWIVNQAPETRLLSVSTDQVYDGEGPHREDAPSPCNVYALTKLWGEAEALAAPRALAIRTNFLGLGGESRRGFADWVIERCLASEGATLFTDVFVSPLYAGDLAEAMTDLAAGEATGVLNLGARDGASKAELIRNLAVRLQLPAEGLRDGRLADVALDARRPHDMRMDVSAAAAALGRPLPSIAESLGRLGGEYRRAAPLQERHRA